MRPPFRDRFFSPTVAHAMTAPSSLVLGAAAAGAAVVVGAPLLAVPIVAAAAWGARVLVAVPRSPRPERIDPFTVGEPWRRFVQDALQARSRFAESVRRTRPGPLRDRLDEIGTRVGTGVDEVWRIAQRGHALTRARRDLDPGDIRRKLAAAEADAGGDGDRDGGPDSALERTAEALRAQLDTVERLDRVIDETHAKLRLLDARLEEAVARTLELSVQTADAAVLGGIGAAVDDVVSEIEALRLALEETGGTAGPGSGTP